MSGGEARAALRGLLRAVGRRTGSEDLRGEVLAEFRRHAGEADAGRVRALLGAARDYEALVEGVNGHKEILLSYNISVDRRDRQKDKVARTARRVGLEVPEGP